MRIERVAALALLLALAAPAAALQAVGSALSLPGGELLYREFHSCEGDGLRCSVEYRDPQGALFALKSLDYSRAPWAPSLSFEDWRHGEQLSLDASSVPAEVVIDAGFDNFVRRQWPALASGETILFHFLPVALNKPVAMRAEVQGSCADNRLCLAVRPQNWLLGLFAGEIELVYSRRERRLLEFRGPSNIADHAGRSQEVQIRYEYPPLDRPAGEAGEQP